MIGRTNSVMIGSKTEQTQLVNYTMLYDSGNECTEVTGGWGKGATNNGTLTVTKNANSINVQNISSYDSYAFIANNTGVDTRQYYKLLVYTDEISTSIRNSRIDITDVRPTSTNYTCVAQSSTITSGKVNSVDLSNVNVSTAFFEVGFGFSATLTNINIHNMFLVKEDNWQEWISKCGYTTDDYATLEALLADSTALEALMNNYDAVKYMLLNCTGTVMASVIQSESALDILTDNKYISMILANIHWKKFLDMVGFKPRTYLYKDGTENVDWISSECYYDPYGDAAITASFTNAYISLTSNEDNGSNSFCAVVTSNKVDMTNYNKLCIEQIPIVSGYYGSAVTISVSTQYASKFTPLARSASAPDGTTYNELDISNITEDVYIYLGVTSYRSTQIYKVWLE